MDIRYALHPDHARTLDTEGLRRHFLVEELFQPDQVRLTYSHVDRIIVGGILPSGLPGSQAVRFDAQLAKHTGTEFFLQRRELGVINIGSGSARVTADGEVFEIASREALYLGMGAKDVAFESLDAANPARLYLNSAPAHRSYPHRKVTQAEASPETLGAAETSNRRTIYKYLVPAVLPTCQLMMGLTQLEAGSLWNTMPSHTHERRMEVYFYFGMKPDGVVFHILGQPQQTRHLVVQNEQAILNPSWSMHSGVGTAAYTFIWGMVGENQVFPDMDHIAPTALR